MSVNLRDAAWQHALVRLMKSQVPLMELQTRMQRFRAEMDASSPDWEIAAIFGKINIYYFTGTMQDGVLLIPRQDKAVLWVRRSYERATDESLFPNIKPMSGFRDAAAAMKSIPSTVYLEVETVPLALYQRFSKHFPFARFRPADAELGRVRAVKSSFELSLMEQSGAIHRRVMEEQVPQILREGMSEAELCADLFSLLIAEGHHGVARFGMFDTDVVVGQIAFGESSLYPTCFDGAGGNYGMSPAVPMLGSRDRKLKSGDMVYLDIGCGIEGYHTDKTVTYLFGRSQSQEVLDIQARCVQIQDRIASMLKPGAIPSEIYNHIMKNMDVGFRENFMGYGGRRVKFLGHGIGLLVDEWPVIAEGFDLPLKEGMALAVEPKKGIANVGMVGIENTFLVTNQGGRSITGCNPGLIPVF